MTKENMPLIHMIHLWMFQYFEPASAMCPQYKNSGIVLKCMIENENTRNSYSSWFTFAEI